MKIKEIDILGITYKIEEVDVVNKEIPRKGEINYITNTIRIDKELTKNGKNQTLMHEILHATFDLLGLDELCEDETKVQAISTALHYVFTKQDIFD